MKKLCARLLALTLCAALVLGEGSIVSAAETVGDTPEMSTELVEETTEDVVEDDSASEDVSEEEVVSEEASEEVSEEISEEVSEEISEEVSEEISEEVSEEISEEASEEISEEVSEEISEEVSEEISEETSEDFIEDASDDVNDELQQTVAASELFPGLASADLLQADNEEQRLALIENGNDFGSYVEGVDYVANEIMVTVYSQEDAEAYAKAFNGTVRVFDTNFAVITLNADPAYPTATAMDAVMASMDAANNLPVAWLNGYYYFYGDVVPVEEVEEEFSEDTYFDEFVDGAIEGDEEMAGFEIEAYNDPYLKSTSGGYQWFHTTIGSAYAWNAGYTGAGVKVGVIDTGITGGHEDLNTSNAKSFLSGVSATKDSVGHGTHVCGIIGAKANNGKGGTGVAPGSTVYSYKVSDAQSINMDLVYSALNTAVRDGMDIVNMSLGGPMYNGTGANTIKAAYNAGVAVFVSAGNDDTNSPYYPASYKGAISIAALDKGNQKASFSCYGTKVDYATPGVDIVSTYNDPSNPYASMDGTSMASPVAAGSAAIVLEYARKNNLLTNTDTAKDVDNLMKLMNKGAVKAKGSGLGKGYISLPKALGLADALKAPGAPVANKKSQTVNAASISLGYNAMPGCTIYYSMDGKTPTYKNGKLSNATQYTGAFTVTGKKSVTVKAIAINNTTKMVSKVSSVKFTFKPLVSSLTIRGEGAATSVAAGKKLKMVPVINPDYAANKKLTWSIVGNPAGITVSSSGVVSVKSNVTDKSFVVKAVTKDGSNKSATATINIIQLNNPVTKIKMNPSKVNVVTGKYVDLSATVTRKDKSVTNASALTWATDDATIAKASKNSNGTVRVTGLKEGKTKLVGLASDGSGKKVTVSVTVGKGVTSVSLIGADALNIGKSTTIETKVLPEDATNKKLEWTIAPEGKGVTVKNGKVTASKSAVAGTYTVTAKTTDGTNIAVSKKITVNTSLMTSLAISEKSATIYRVSGSTGKSPTTKTITVTTAGGNSTQWIATSSNEDIATVSKSGNTVRIAATGKATGNVTITIKSVDGSNKKATCKVKVINPASGLLLSVPSGRCTFLAKGKTMNLVSTLEAEYGKLDSSTKKLTWTSSSPSNISVDKNGKVKALTDNGVYVTITAKTADGTLQASIDIACVSVIKSITIGSPIYDYYTGKVGDSGYIPVYLSLGGNRYISSAQFNYTVSGGDGVTLSMTSPSALEITANKKGTYILTIKTKEGCGKTASVKLVIS